MQFPEKQRSDRFASVHCKETGYNLLFAIRSRPTLELEPRGDYASLYRELIKFSRTADALSCTPPMPNAPCATFTDRSKLPGVKLSDRGRNWGRKRSDVFKLRA